MARLAAILGLLTILAAGVSGNDGDGGHAAPWLQVPIGARPTAMGGAYLAVSDDGAAPLFNPAGLARLQRPMFSSSYRVMALGRKLGYVTALSPVRGEATLGVHWLYAGSGSVEARDSDGYLAGHDISMNSHQFAIVFAKRFERYFSLGVNLNYILSRMSELDASAVGFDFGLMVYVEQLYSRERRDLLPVRDIQIGITLKNFSKTLRWVSDKYDLKYSTSGDIGSIQDDKVPVELGLGISARFFDRKLLTAIDLKKTTSSRFFYMPVQSISSGRNLCCGPVTPTVVSQPAPDTSFKLAATPWRSTMPSRLIKLMKAPNIFSRSTCFSKDGV